MSYEKIPHFHRQIILDELNKIQFDTLLEVGCGEGTNMFYIRRDFPDAKITGLDNDISRIVMCEEQFGRDYCQVGNAVALPYKDKSFDIILFDAVLMYLSPEDIEKALAEAYRVAKKAVVVCDQNDIVKEPDIKIPIQGWDAKWDTGFIVVKKQVEEKKEEPKTEPKKRGRPKIEKPVIKKRGRPRKIK